MTVTERKAPIAASFHSSNGELDSKQVPEYQKAPTDTPPFTLKELKNAIPAHCFERSLWRSTLYLVWDLVMVLALLAVGIWVYNSDLPWYAKVVFWPVYWFCQGCVSFGVWIIAHECGHYSYCDSKAICDWLGLVLHTALLVPYHSWRISHSNHHKNTNRMDGDEAFVPNTRERLEHENDLEFPNAFSRAVHLFKYLTIGWPGYLLFHARGRPYDKHVDHFNPNAQIFKKKEFWDVVISDIALAVWIGALVYMGSTFGSMRVLFLYVIPYLNVNMWLVIVTYLQHTDITVPHYDDKEWTWLKGALGTMDRDYGLLNTIFHNLTDAHIVHHLFSYMPHYHMKEATEAIKPILGGYYNYDATPVWTALWKSDSHCRFVENDGGVRWYKTYKHQ